MNPAGRNPGLREARIQGTYSFPCTMYMADSNARGAEPTFDVKPHWHSAFELIHFEKGDFTLNINAAQYRPDTEAFCIVESEKLHSLRADSPYLEQALVFDPSIVSSAGEDESTKSLIDPFIYNRLTFPQLIIPGDACFEEISDEFGCLRGIFTKEGEAHENQLFLRNAATQLRVKASILTILASLSEHGLISSIAKREDPRMEALKKVILFIQNHYAEKIYIRDLADIMHMNEQYFSRFFSKTVGRPPVAYINDIRIRKAALLLSDPSVEASVLDISQMCGFGNTGHFITEFRKRTGTAPITYRIDKRLAFVPEN